MINSIRKLLPNEGKGLLKNKNRNYVLISQVINAIIALISGKLIAVFILPADFGTYNLQFAAYTFFFSLLINPYLHFAKSSNNTILPKIGSKFFLWTIIGLATLTYLALEGFMYIYYGELNITLSIVFLVFIPISILSSIIGDYLNTTNKLVPLSQLNIVRGLAGVIFLSLFFVLGSTSIKHVEVLWIMNLIGALVGLAIFVRKYKYFREKVKIAYFTFIKKYINFARPLLLFAFWMWINNYFDRYVIEFYLSNKEVGIYNANYSVGSKFFLLLSPIFITLLIPKVYAIRAIESKKEIISRYSLIYCVLSIPILITVFYFQDWIGNLLLSESYSSGFHLIFWIGLSFFLITITEFFQMIFYAEMRTKYILWGTMFSAIVNILLNIILVPQLGIFGAGLATLFAFGVNLTIIIIYFKRI